MTATALDPAEAAARRRVVTASAERLAVIAGPGSGKTALLVERLFHLLDAEAVPPRAVAAVVFNREAAAEMRRRLAAGAGNRGWAELRISTFHSLALAIVDRFWRRTPLASRPFLIPTGEQRALVARLLADRDADRDEWPVPANVRTSPAYATAVADALLRVQERMLSPEALADRSEPHLARLLVRYQRQLAARGAVDYAQVLALAASVAAEPESAAALGISHLLVDEYQDVNPAQATLVHNIGAACTSVVVVGDPDQSIYGFRGATPHAISGAARDLGAEVVSLRHGFRCAQPVVAAASTLVGDRPLTGVEAPGGVGAAVFAHRNDELEWIADHLTALGAGCEWRQLAVLCRSLRGVRAPLTAALARAGIPAHVVGAGSSRTAMPPAGGDRHPWVARADDLVALAVDPPGQNADLDDRLLSLAVSPLVAADPLLARQVLRRERFGAGGDWMAALSSSSDPALQALADALAAGHEAARQGAPVDAVAWQAWQRLPLAIAVARAMVDDLDGETAEGVGAIGRWHAGLSRFVERAERGGSGASAGAYLQARARGAGGDDPWVGSEAGALVDAVWIGTIHQAKGLEFDHVVVPSLEEGRFPILSRRGSAWPASADGEAESPMAEERRLLFVALTRARVSATLTATIGAADRLEASPSRFLAELEQHLIDPAALPGRPAQDAASPSRILIGGAPTVRHARRVWGRAARDKTRPRAEREAAVAGLRALGTARPPWLPAVPARLQPDPFGGPRRLSASAVDAYLTCPRQFLLANLLGLGPPAAGAALAFGSALHVAIADWLGAGEPPEVEALLTRMTDAFSAIPDEAFAVAAQRAHYARLLPDAAHHVAAAVAELGTAIIVEHTARRELDADVTLTGRFDAVTRDAAGVSRVVDWKSGSVNRDTASGAIAAYDVLAERDFPEVAELVLVGIDGKRRAEPAGNEARRGHRDVVDAVVAGLRQGRFQPQPGAHCRFCDVAALCDQSKTGGRVPW